MLNMQTKYQTVTTQTLAQKSTFLDESLLSSSFVTHVRRLLWLTPPNTANVPNILMQIFEAVLYFQSNKQKNPYPLHLAAKNIQTKISFVLLIYVLLCLSWGKRSPISFEALLTKNLSLFLLSCLKGLLVMPARNQSPELTSSLCVWFP